MATAAALVLFSGGALAHAEQPVGGSSAGIAFDEIDRVVPGAADAAPGNFERDVALIGNAGLPVAAPQPKPKRGIMGALGSAGAMLGGLSTVVNAGGSLSTALGIAEFGQQIAPVANILGLTGSANWGGLVQQYMLPQMSPSLVPYVSGYLSAQSAVKSAFGRPATASAPDAAALQQYSTGTLKHYAVTSNGWVRIEDASSGRVVINRPDERKSYALDPATKTYSVTDLTHEPDGAAVQPGAAQALLSETTEPLGPAKIAGIDAAGYRTDAAVTISGASGTCKNATYRSRRVEYVTTMADPAAASRASALPTATGGCAPTTVVRRNGPQIPSNKLLLYMANTIDKDDGTGAPTVTMIEERGNVRPLGASEGASFSIPQDYTRR
ncbi:MAG: hypothetical protein NVSMB5_09930 [Candidatus Velthaea sp.]